MTLQKGFWRKGVIALAVGLPVVVALILALRPSGRDLQRASTTLTILGHTQEDGRQVVTFELRVPPGRRIAVMEGYLVTDWGTSTAHHGPPEWTKGCDPSRKTFGPGTRALLSIIEPTQRLRRLRLETLEFGVGLRAWASKVNLFYQTRKLSALKMPPAPKGIVYVQSGLISSYGSEQGGSANGTQPSRSETNGMLGTGGSRR